MNRIVKIIIALFLIIPINHLEAQEWIVPKDISELSNPSDYNLKNVKQGKVLYNQHCKSCHGDPGKHNSLPLIPVPPDMASEKMQLNSEGDLFYKISNGKGSMPQFEASISESDRWKLVNFIMNFSPINKPLLVEAPPIKAKLFTSVDEDKNMLEIIAEHDDVNLQNKKLTDVPVFISSKTTFGKLLIGKAITDKNGKAIFIMPETVIGDEKGLLSIVVSLDENYEAKELILEKVKLGKPSIAPRLIKRGVIWSTNEYIPLWSLLVYIGGAGGAWLAIGYVIFQIVKIKKYSKL